MNPKQLNPRQSTEQSFTDKIQFRLEAIYDKVHRALPQPSGLVLMSNLLQLYAWPVYAYSICKDVPHVFGSSFVKNQTTYQQHRWCLQDIQRFSDPAIQRLMGELQAAKRHA